MPFNYKTIESFVLFTASSISGATMTKIETAADGTANSQANSGFTNDTPGSGSASVAFGETDGTTKDGEGD